jgi:hypothetical protein
VGVMRAPAQKDRFDRGCRPYMAFMRADCNVLRRRRGNAKGLYFIDLGGNLFKFISRRRPLLFKRAPLVPSGGLYRLAAQLGRELPQINRVRIALVRSATPSVLRARGKEGDRAAG